MGYAHSYARAIMHRGRISMEPIGFTPDWSDRPRKWKHYPGVESVPLPDEEPTGTLQDGLLGGAGGRPFTPGLLGGMLRDSYGLLGRRLAIQANTDMASLPSYPHANWHRGAASGGGLYPVSVYWVSGGGGPVLPGVRYYSPAQHAMQTLATGDVSGDVRAALGEPTPDAACDQFLVLGVKYWQNAFKYNSFCFHAVSMDVGAAVATMRMWGRAAGLRVEPSWWFDEQRISRLLGLDDGEGVFAVIPLSFERVRQVAPARSSGGLHVRHRESERSRRTFTFDAVRRMHASTVQHAPGTPSRTELAPAAVGERSGPGVALPECLPLDVPVRSALRSRRSSFGRFEATSPMPLAELATTLAAAARAAHDTVPLTGGHRLTRLYVFVNRVEDLAPGTYSYDDGRLTLLDAEEPGRFLQDNYFLANYNLEEAAAVVVPAIRTCAVLDAVGDRGYRLVNATVGAVAQAFYAAATGLGLGCGVALGFDSVSYIERLDVSETGELPLLLMMVGAERPGSADFRYEIA